MVGLNLDQLAKLPRGISGITRTQYVQQLVELYNESDVLINPTYSDNFPTTNIEALACGTPVITYRTGGTPEAVCEEENIMRLEDCTEVYSTGMVVSQGNVTALANAIMYLREHPIPSSACRHRAEALFDKDKCFERYVELYEELLKNK